MASKKQKTPVPLSAIAYVNAMGKTSAPNLTNAQWFQFNGPWEFGGALWSVATSLDGVNNPIEVFKSTDSGATWTAINTAGAITTAEGPKVFAVSRSGNILYVLYQNGTVGTSSTGLRIRPFDLAAGLWGSDSPDCPNTAYPGTNSTNVSTFGISTIGGASNVVFNRARTVAAVTTYQIIQVRFDGVSTWSGETQIGAELAANPVITGVTLDPSDGTMRVLYSQYQAAGSSPLSPNPVHEVAVSPAGSVGAAEVVIADAVQASMSSGFFNTYPSFGPGTVLNGVAYVPFGLNLGGGAHDVIPALAIESAGSWTVVQLDSDVNGTLSNTGLSVAAFSSGPWVYVLWIIFLSGDPTNGTIRYTRTMDGGVTFDPIATLWDPTVNPPPFSPIASATVPSAALLSSGLIGVTYNIDSADFSHFFRSFLANGTSVSSPIPPPVLTGGGTPRRKPVCPTDYLRLFMIERFAVYALKIPSLPSGASLLSQPLPINTDAPFLVRGRGLRIAPPVDTRSQSPDVDLLRFRYKNAAGEYLAPVPIKTPQDFWNAYGFGGIYRPVYPQQPYPPGSVIEVDVVNDGPDDITNLYVIFIGVKLFKDGAIPNPTYPLQMATPRPFDYQSGKGTPTDPALVLATTSELRQQPFNVRSDADFVLRAGQAGLWSSTGAGGLYSPFGYTELYLQLYDATLKPYFNIPIHIDWIFGNAGGGVSLPPANYQMGNAAPGLIVPEIYLPANSVMYFDLFRNDAPYVGVTDSLPVRIMITWQGMKVYPK